MKNGNGWQMQVGGDGTAQEQAEQYPITSTIASPLVQKASTVTQDDVVQS
jgi:hypothetical protein